MKKIIIGTLGALFASAIAVAVWSSNVKANDLLAMNVEALAGAEWVGGEYIKGQPLTNWKTYPVQCQEEKTTAEYSLNYGYSMGQGASVKVSDPYGISSVSVGGSNTSYSNYSEKGTKGTGSDLSMTKEVCGKGAGCCLSSAPEGSNPCI